MIVVYSYRSHHDGAMVGVVHHGATPPWSWASLPGVGTAEYEDHSRVDFIPSIDNEGPRPGYRWTYDYRESAGCKLFGYLALGPWLVSERYPSSVCNQCGRSGPWHLFNLCEDAR